MPAQILDGTAIASQEKELIAARTKLLVNNYGIIPGLAVILVGDNPASLVYVNIKQKACRAVGFHTVRFVFPENVDENTILSTIDRLNNDPLIHGILVQLPLSPHLNTDTIIERISPEKDVDGLTSSNFGQLAGGSPLIIPCTALGIYKLLVSIHYPLEGAYITVIGSSKIVGRPVALLLMIYGATLTMCHSRTRLLSKHTQMADIVVSATGVPGLVTGNAIKSGAVIIDVGITKDSQGRLWGDVDFESCAKKASYITPVPGGVGPMTVAMLLYNTLTLAERQVALHENS